MEIFGEDFKARFVDPQRAVFSESSSGNLQLKTDTNFYQKVRLFCLFPLYSKTKYIAVCAAHKDELEEIGIIKDITEFSEEQQKLICKKLEERYLILDIHKIISIKESGDNLFWKVETDYGEIEFTIHDPYENIRILQDKKMLLIDIYQHRYIINNINIINGKTREILSKHIYL